MPESKIIQVRLNDNYLKMIDEILEHEKKYYHFVGDRSALLKLIIFGYHEQTLADIEARKQYEKLKKRKKSKITGEK